MLKKALPICLSLLLFISHNGFAADGVVAKLLHIKGKVKVRHAGTKKWIKGKSGQPGYKNTVVKTGKNSIAIIQVESKLSRQILKLEKSSSLTLKKLEMKKQTSKLNKGSVFLKLKRKVKEMTKGPRVRLITKSVAMGVRGTQFFASFGPKGHEKDFWMCVNEGNVKVKSLKSKKSVSVKEGEGILVPAGEEVTPPQEYAWTKKLNWNMDHTKGELQNKAKIQGVYNDLLDQDYD